MTIQEAQEAVDKWIKDYGVRYFNEMTNMAILTEEVGEVARIMARRLANSRLKTANGSTWLTNSPTFCGCLCASQTKQVST